MKNEPEIDRNLASHLRDVLLLGHANRRHRHAAGGAHPHPEHLQQEPSPAYGGEQAASQGKYTLQEQVTIKRAADRKRYSWFVRWEEFAQIKSDTPLYLQRVRIAK